MSRFVPARNRSTKKARSSSPGPEGDIHRVFIWDLEETIVIFHALLTGAYAQRFGKVSHESVTSGLHATCGPMLSKST